MDIRCAPRLGLPCLLVLAGAWAPAAWGQVIPLDVPVAPVSPTAPAAPLPPALDMAPPPMITNGTLNGQMFNDQTETLTPKGIIDDKTPEGDGFGFSPAEELPPAPPFVSAPVSPVAPPPALVSPVSVAGAAAPLPAVAAASPTVPHGYRMYAATLGFSADSTALAPAEQARLKQFIAQAKADAPLKTLTLTQRTVLPAFAGVGTLNSLTDSRRAAILAPLKAAGVIDGHTQVAELRVRDSAPKSKTTLTGR
jgi:hypothetical protein